MFKKKHNNDDDVVPNEDVDLKAASDDSNINGVSNDSNDLDDSVVAEENVAETIKKLRERLKKAETDKQEYLTGWQRAKADLINARKRDEEDRKDFMKFANEQVIGDLIAVLDSFDMAMNNKEAWEKADKNWRTGVEYIFSQLKKTLSDYGLKELNPIDEAYDHAQHEAISHESVTDEKSDNKILQVIQRGYSLNGKIIKVPKVKVGEWKR